MKIWKYLFGFLFLITILLWMVVYELPDNNLHLIACDVGQGDATLAVYKNIQILTDGGIPNGKAVECLSKHIPFWDREIEVVINTHPQLDHYGGLTEIFKRYKVDYFIANALTASTPQYEVLRKEVGSKGVVVVNPLSGTSIRGGLIHYDIFWPSQPFLASEGYDFKQGSLNTFASNRDPNDFSVQAILSLGNFAALMTGDIGENMSEAVLPYVPKVSINYIKVPHHGSRYGLTSNYLKWFDPKVAVISVGKNNTYGHPTKEILNILNDEGVKTFRTDINGEVEVVTDGDKYWIKK